MNRSSAEWLRLFFDTGNCLSISSALIRRKLIRKVGNFNPVMFQLSDFDLWVRMAAVGELFIVPEKMTYMRIVGGKNISGPIPAGGRRSCIELLEILKRYLKNPVFKRLPDVFADIMTTSDKKDITILASLAQHAWKLSPTHILFANQIISDIITDSKKRAQLIKLFGTDIMVL